MAIRFGAKVSRIEFENDWPVTILENGRRIRSEMLLYAAGRVGATDSLNLQSCGMTPDDRGRLKVDPATFQTEVPHIYSAGDAIGFPSSLPRQWSRDVSRPVMPSTSPCRLPPIIFRMASIPFLRFPPLNE